MNEYLEEVIEFCTRKDIFPKPPDLVHWNDDSECHEICWFSNYYIVIDTNESMQIEFRKFPGPGVRVFSSLEKFKEFCIMCPEMLKIK